MTFGQALAYFVREALLSLRRGWRVGLLAVLTIATSLFVGGLFLLLTHNLGQATRSWRSEARLVAYLPPEAPAGAAVALAAALRERQGVRAATVVTPEEARRRLREGLPGLVEVIDAADAPALPSSVEIEFAPDLDAAGARDLAAELRARPEVDLVDDDRDWLGRLEALVTLGRVAGLALGGLLLVAAVLTIYSVIRLTAHLYREEIAVMRLVGATELLVRGPFYLEGALQGLLGGGVAIGGLGLVHLVAHRAGTAAGLLGQVLFERFLPPAGLLALLALGALSGLLGAVLSLRREVAGEVAAGEAQPEPA